MAQFWFAAVFAWAAVFVVPARAEDAGADAFRRACAECHAQAAVVARRFANLGPDMRRQRWETFLQRHHGGDADQRAALIRYFESVAPAR